MVQWRGRVRKGIPGVCALAAIGRTVVGLQVSLQYLNLVSSVWVHRGECFEARPWTSGMMATLWLS